METTQRSAASHPEGQAIDCPSMPVLKPTHIERLRKLWSLGRPAHVVGLGGIELDLIVHGLIETIDNTYSPNPVLIVTRRGVIRLSEARQSRVAAQQPHHELGARLARHLQGKGYLTWENVEFANPIRTHPKNWDQVRPDVFACMPATQAEYTASGIYEVKANRADFLADMAKPSKREAYAQLAAAVYYCCPEGLIDRAELPKGYGLIVESATGVFTLKKRASRSKGFTLALDTALTLMVKRQAPLD